MRNEKGFALVTVLLLGSISMVLVAFGAYLVSTGTMVSGVQKRYQGEVETAAGVAELVMGQFLAGTLTCVDAATWCVPDPTCVAPTSQVFFPALVCNSLDKPGCNNLSACIMSRDIDTADPTKTLLSVKVTSRSEGSELAIIDVVFEFNN